MNKKEVSEIKRQFSPSYCSILRICGCYVDADKNKKTEFKEAFLTLPDEEMFKYFEILRKCLSGKIGKNLINMNFTKDAEMEDGQQTLLLRMRDSRLNDEDSLNDFYDRVINSYGYTGNYLILLIHDAYDVPGKASDGIEMDDASDEVYSYIMCCICPVELSKPGLGYNEHIGEFQNLDRDWVVGMPDTGFLFPAFNDRSSDIHSTLVYAKKNMFDAFTQVILGCSVPMSPEYQKQAFSELIESTLGTECTYEAVKSIHDNIRELMEESKDSPDPLFLYKESVYSIFESIGCDEVEMKDFSAIWDNLFGGNEIAAANLVSEKEIRIKLPDAAIKLDPNCSSMANIQYIDGKKCLVIDISGNIEIDGVACER